MNPPDEIGLPAREYYNNTKTVAEYTDIAEQVLGSFIGGSANIRDVVKFEAKLADVSPDTQTREDVTKSYNPRTLENTEKLLPEISISSIISALAPSGYKTERVIVGSPSYMESLSSILGETSRETVQLFFKWKLIQSFANNIEDPKIRPLREFNNKLDGKDPQAAEERWRKCVQVLDDSVPWSLSRFYIEQFFSQGSKQLGDRIISDIKERFVFTLHQTSWMSPDVKELGIQKVGNIVQKIGYPTKSPNVMDPNEIKKYYDTLKVSNQTFFENQLAAAEFDVQREWSKLGKPTDRNEWDMSAPTVNAYYNPPGNEIVFPAGIMQPPVFYGPSAPLYLAYGAFGAVSGHELSHGKLSYLLSESGTREQTDASSSIRLKRSTLRSDGQLHRLVGQKNDRCIRRTRSMLRRPIFQIYRARTRREAAARQWPSDAGREHRGRGRSHSGVPRLEETRRELAGPRAARPVDVQQGAIVFHLVWELVV